MKPNEDIQVEDGEDFRSTGELGIKQIALDQYRRCCLEGSREMLRGGETTKIIKGVPVNVQVDNQREIFMNSVLMLEIVLAPNLSEKEKISEQMGDVDEDISKIKDKYQESFDDFNERYKKGKNLSWNKNITLIQDNMEMELIEPFRKKLMVLSILLKSINYFDEGSVGD